jgi:hypothetical protein
MRSVIENAPYEHMVESSAGLEWRVGSEAGQFVVDQNVWSASAENLTPWSPDFSLLLVAVEVCEETRGRVFGLARRLGGNSVLCITWSCPEAGIRGVGTPAAVGTGGGVTASLQLPSGLLRGTLRLGVEVFLARESASERGVSTGARIAVLGPRQEVLVDGSGGSLPIANFGDPAGVLWCTDFPSLDPTCGFGVDGCLLKLNALHRDYPLLRDEFGAPTPLMHEVITAWLTVLMLEYVAANGADKHADALRAFRSTGDVNLAAFVNRAAEGARLELWNVGVLSTARVQELISSWVFSSRVRRATR